MPLHIIPFYSPSYACYVKATTYSKVVYLTQNNAPGTGEMVNECQARDRSKQYQITSQYSRQTAYVCIACRPCFIHEYWEFVEDKIIYLF